MRYYLLVLDEQVIKGSPKRALTEKESIKIDLGSYEGDINITLTLEQFQSFFFRSTLSLRATFKRTQN